MRLLLARHAHAEDSGIAPSDHARRLTSRGRREAGALGGRVASHLASPGRVLCSSAVRAVETLTELQRQLRGAPPVDVSDALYLASARVILDGVRRTSAEIRSLLVVAHNPGVAELAVHLAGRGEREALDRLARRFPPASLAALELDVDRWEDVELGDGVLVEFVGPD